MDETSVCVFQGDVKGNIMTTRKRGASEPYQRVSKGRRRTCFTHIAFICDRPELQPLLPQVVVGNLSALQSREIATLRAAAPSNFVLVRQKSAWNNEVLCASVIRLLGRVLHRHAAEAQPVLIFDAVRFHTAPRVLAACRSAGIWPLLVPAKLTWLLQPLDTHAFRFYKSSLKNEYQAERARLGRAELTVGQFLSVLYTATRRVLNGRRWSLAFNENGFGVRQVGLSAGVMRALCLETPCLIASARPVEAQLQACFPKRSRIPRGLLPDTVEHGTDHSDPIDTVPSTPRTRAECRRARGDASGPPDLMVAGQISGGVASSSSRAIIPASCAIPRGRRLFPRRRPSVPRTEGEHASIAKNSVDQ